MRVILALLLLALATPAQSAAVRYVNDQPGGILIDHIEKFNAWRRADDPVVVNGDCLSACTLLLGIVKRACATPSGVFGFHSASVHGRYTLEGTRVMWWFYRPHVRAALAARGWAEPSKHPDIIRVPATELLPRCPGSTKTRERINEKTN